MVIGAGTIGLMTLQAVALAGVEWTGVLELQDDRRRAARELGATEVFGEAEALRSAAGGEGVDLAFDAVGAGATRGLAIELLRPGGCAVMIGLATDATPVGFHAVVREGLTVRAPTPTPRTTTTRRSPCSSTAAPGWASWRPSCRSTPARRRSRSWPRGPPRT